LKIESAGFSALLPADIERSAESRLIATYGEQLQADLLLSPHHGSRTSSSPEFIAAVSPKIVIHSAGWHHRFHHPRPEVVERYRTAGAQQFNTATTGAVSIARIDGGVIEIRAERRESPRLWSNDAD
jgi:competence protein ComEC